MGIKLAFVAFIALIVYAASENFAVVLMVLCWMFFVAGPELLSRDE